jgi:hypothetical protein
MCAPENPGANYMVAPAPAVAAVRPGRDGKTILRGLSNGGSARKVPSLIGFSPVMPYHRRAFLERTTDSPWQKTYF